MQIELIKSERQMNKTVRLGVEEEEPKARGSEESSTIVKQVPQLEARKLFDVNSPRKTVGVRGTRRHTLVRPVKTDDPTDVRFKEIEVCTFISWVADGRSKLANGLQDLIENTFRAVENLM